MNGTVLAVLMALQATVVTSFDAAPESTSVVAQTTSDQSEEPVITEIRQFRFEFANCERTRNPESPYRCNFLVENIGRDSVPISINGDVAPQRTSYIVDRQGRRINATMIDVAGDRQSFYGTAQAPPGVPMRVSLFLETVPVEEVSYIELYCTAPRDPGQQFSATFSDLEYEVD